MSRRCNTKNTKPADAANAARRQSEHDPGTRAEASQSGVQRRGSARATSAIWVGRESPSLEFDAGKPARRRDHCPAPDRSVLHPTGTPLRSVAPATPRSDCGLPQTTKAAAVPDPEQERQIGARRSELEPRRDQSLQWHPHGHVCGLAMAGQPIQPQFSRWPQA
jgi:hypothetical protein